MSERFGRTSPTTGTTGAATLEGAERDYDRFCFDTADRRRRRGRTVADLAREEHLLKLPERPYPALIEVQRNVGDSSLVACRGNRYSIYHVRTGAD